MQVEEVAFMTEEDNNLTAHVNNMMQITSLLSFMIGLLPTQRRHLTYVIKEMRSLHTCL
jgi:hypothetical protein